MERLQVGSVSLIRFFCPVCKEYTLCDSNEIRCSHCCIKSKIDQTIKRVRKIGEQKHKRVFSRALIRRKAEEQNNRCYWCGRPFGMMYMRGVLPLQGNLLHRLHIVGDHYIPYAYCQTTTKKNLVAACDRCNAFKSSKMFRTDDDVREYLRGKWNDRINRGVYLIPRDDSVWDRPYDEDDE